MGVVYRAHREEGGFRQDVAIKLMRFGASDPILQARFLAERQILSDLDHPNLCQLLDGGVTDEAQPYIVMEYVEGLPITEYCVTHALDTEQRLRLFSEVCSAVDSAHRNLIVHRDLKPANILVSDEGKVKLLDFGVAKWLDEAAVGLPSDLTISGSSPLTPDYAAPEQVLEETVTTSTDIYALGVILFEMLTGCRPRQLSTKTLTERHRILAQEEAPRASSLAGNARLRRKLKGDLDLIVAKCLRREPERRYHSAQELAEDLQRRKTGLPVNAAPDSNRYRLKKFLRRHRLGVTAATLVLLAAVVGMAGIAWQAGVAARERDQAQREAAKALAVTDFLLEIFQSNDPAVAGLGAEVSARQLLERGVERVESELAGQPDLQADLMGAMGLIYLNIGLQPEALALYGRRLELRRELGDQAEISTAMMDYATPLEAMGEYEESLALVEEALEIRRRLYGEIHVETAQAYDFLGGSLSMHPDRLEEALACRLKALEIRQQLLPSQDNWIAVSYNNVGTALDELGRGDEAIPYLEKAVEIWRIQRDPINKNLPAALNNLALRLGENDPQKAEEHLREAIAICEEIGIEGQVYANALNSLGGQLMARAQAVEAEPILRRSLVLNLRSAGPDALQTAAAHLNLGKSLRQQGRFAEAEPELEAGLEVFEKTLGPEHPYTGAALSLLAWLRMDEERTREAQTLLERACPIMEVQPAMVPDHLGRALTQLAELALERSELAESEALVRRALAVLELENEKGALNRAWTRSLLGVCLMEQGQHEDGRTELTAALAALRAGCAPADERLRQAEERYQRYFSPETN